MHRMMSSDPSATRGVTLTPGLVRRVWTFAHAYRLRVFGFLAIVVVESFLGLVPPLVTHMIAVGERSGELEAMLGKVADAYESEVESLLGTLTAVLEPITIVVMGGIVLFIVLAILLPIFEINALVR